jgi:hypothetical protein
MADLTPQQTQLMWVLKWLFRASILSFVLLGCLILYFYEMSPTAADTASGHVYPYYDKLHSNYVYLTELESNSMSVLLCVGVGCVFCSIFIDFKLKRSVKVSDQNTQQREGPDHDNLHE